MARTKTTANSSPPRVNYRALYPWAPDELLSKCSSLTSLKDWQDHVGDLSVYQYSAFARRHNGYISVQPCTKGEPVCVDDRSNNGVPFFFFY